MELEQPDGAIAVVDHGTLVETRPAGAPNRLTPTSPVVGAVSEVPPSVETAEEASIIWRWLEANRVRVLECTGVFAHPAQRLVRLTESRRAA
jgi:hypothetical protein